MSSALIKLFDALVMPQSHHTPGPVRAVPGLFLTKITRPLTGLTSWARAVPFEFCPPPVLIRAPYGTLEGHAQPRQAVRSLMWRREQHRHKIHSALRTRNRTGYKNRTGPMVGCDWGIRRRIIWLNAVLQLFDLPTNHNYALTKHLIFMPWAYLTYCYC